MEAFAVNLIPPRAPQSPDSIHAEQYDGESSFAPTLTKAINDNKNSQEGLVKDPNIGKTPANRKESSQPSPQKGKSEESPDQDLETVTGAAILAEIQQPLEIKAQLGFFRQPGNGGSAFQPVTVLASMDGQAETATAAGSKVPMESVPPQTFVTPQALVSPQDLVTGQSPVTPQDLFSSKSSADQTGKIPLAESGKVRISATLQSGNVDLSTLKPTPATLSRNPSLPQNLENTLILQKNDSVNWAWGNAKTPHIIQNNNPILQSGMETTLSAAPPLSTEKIIAALTEIPVQRKINTPLRGNDATLRQDISGQLFAAKTQNPDMSSRNSGEQFLDSESEAANQTQLGAAVKAGEGPSESSFSQSLNQLVVDKSSQPPGEIVRSPTVPFTQPVNENDILQQVMQKFRISRYLQDSKLELKLHPAELGELKISIQLKDGSINANIVAQSQQVMGILEKNLPRLKELMEQQGLHVGEISIHLDADVPSDYDLFEEQSAQDSSPFSNRKNNHSGVAFTLESADEEDGSADNPFQPGVNVKI